jgi:hypothetical protein
MPSGTNCSRTGVACKARGWASLVVMLMLALILAWVFPSDKAFSYFQSPISPLPGQIALPTGMPSPTRAEPTSSPPPPTVESTPTGDTIGMNTPAPPASQAPSTQTAVAPAVEEQTIPSPTLVETVSTPDATGPAQIAEPIPDESPAEGGAPLWPWIVLGVFSVGAMAAGVYLLRREAPDQDVKTQTQ